MIRQIRRPQVLVALGVGGRPSSAVGERSADILPGGAIGRCLQADAVGCESSEVGAIGFLDDGWVVNEGITLDRTRVDSPLLERRCQSADGKKTTSEEGAKRHHNEGFVSGYP